MADVRINIPTAVLRHWGERLDEIRRRGAGTDLTDQTYLKVAQALDKAGGRCFIQAGAADLVELDAECANWLDTETDVSLGRDPSDRAFRDGYRKLRIAVAAAKR